MHDGIILIKRTWNMSDEDAVSAALWDIYRSCSLTKKNIAKGTTDPRVEFILPM